MLLVLIAIGTLTIAVFIGFYLTYMCIRILSCRLNSLGSWDESTTSTEEIPKS